MHNDLVVENKDFLTVIAQNVKYKICISLDCIVKMFFKNLFLYLYECLSAYVYMHLCLVPVEARRASDPVELGLWSSGCACWKLNLGSLS